MSESEDQNVNVWKRFLTALKWLCNCLESFMHDHGQICKRDLFLEICFLAGFRHVGHGQRHQGAARGAAPWGRGGGPVAASGQGHGPSGKGAVLQRSSRWTGDSNHHWTKVGDRQVSVPGQGRSTGKQRLKNPGGPWYFDSRPVAM